MRRLCLLGAALAALAASLPAHAQFVDCQSSRNSGFNLASWITRSLMASEGDILSPQQLIRSESQLEQVFSGYAARGSMARGLKVCHFEGIYQGYVSTLLGQYRRCRAVPSADTLGGGGGAVLNAVYATLGEETDGEALAAVFASAIAPLGAEGRSSCRTRLFGSVLNRFADDPVALQLTIEASALVCGETDSEAGSEPPAGVP